MTLKPVGITEDGAFVGRAADWLTARIAEAVGSSEDRPQLLSNVSGLYRLAEGPWGDALAAVRAGERDAKVLIISDSTAAGIGGSTEATFPQAKSWPHNLAALLGELSIAAANGLAVPKSSSGAQPSDSRWTLGSGWSQSNVVVGLGNKSSNYRATGAATGALTFNDPRVVADRFDVYLARSTSASYGTATVSATGGAPVVVPLGSQPTKGITKVTVSAAALATSNVVSITNTGGAGDVYVVGVEPWDSTARKVRIGNAGMSGSSSVGWVAYQADDTTNLWNVFGFLPAYDADLVIISLGINDADPSNLTDIPTYRANIEALAAAARANGASVLLMTMIPSDATRYAREALLVDEMIATGLPIIDIFHHFGTWDAELMDDSVHGNDTMYVQEAKYVHEALMRSSLSPVPYMARRLPARKPVTNTTYTVRLDADQIAQESGTFVPSQYDERGYLFSTAAISGASAPKLMADEIDGLPVLWFDGIANGLGLTLTRTQPHTLVLQFRIRSLIAGVNNMLVASSQSSPNRGTVFVGSDGKLRMNAGSTLTGTDDAPTTMQTCIFTFNGASSRLTGPATTNTGTVGTENASLILLGRSGSGDPSRLNLRRLLVYPSAFDASMEAQIRADLAA